MKTKTVLSIILVAICFTFAFSFASLPADAQIGGQRTPIGRPTSAGMPTLARATITPRATFSGLPTLAQALPTLPTLDGSSTATVSIPESVVAMLTTEALAAAGYPGATVDLISGGMTVTVPGFTYGQTSGTLVMTAGVSVQGNIISLTVVSVTLNGRAIPVAAVAGIVEALEVAINDILFMLAGGSTVAFTVDQLVFTDAEMIVTMTLDYSGALPTITNTPRPRRN